MQPQRTLAAKSGILVARGYGLKVRVQNGHLVVEDGFGRQRRTCRLPRTSKLRRLLVIGRSGYVTLDALRWLHDTGAAFLHLDTNGELIAASVANGPDFAALRRAQALAADGPAGVEIARYVLTLKVQGQHALAPDLPGGEAAIDPIETMRSEIEHTTELAQMLAAEALAADRYWQAWAELPIPFPNREASKLPKHWMTFGQRASLITGSPRVATNPAGAILNYLYALLEAETTLACLTVGLDPGVGIFHLDRRDRASLALDLMEAVRPAVDAYVLALLTQRALSARDFSETRKGACRMAPRLAASLTDTCSLWRSHVGPVVERTAHTLAEHSPAPLPTLTPITRANSKRAWDQRAPDRRTPALLDTFAVLPATCRDCGTALPDRRRRYCDACLAQKRQAQGPAARARAGEVLAQLRSERRDPAHGGRAAEIRGTKNAAHQVAVRAWKGERMAPEIFRSEILPGLRRKPVAELVAATGLSDHYCSLIRLGKKVPHARHWDALWRLAG